MKYKKPPVRGVDPMQGINKGRRNSLKMLGGTGALVSSGLAGASSLLTSDAGNRSNEISRPIIPAQFKTPDLAISVMMARSVRDHWVVIENLTAAPLNIKTFSPATVNYRYFQVDLNQLIQRDSSMLGGSSDASLQIESDYAWSESLAGISVWVPHRTAFTTTDGNSSIRAISADTEVLKLWAVVSDSDAHVYTEEADGQPLIVA